MLLAVQRPTGRKAAIPASRLTDFLKPHGTQYRRIDRVVLDKIRELGLSDAWDAVFDEATSDADAIDRFLVLYGDQECE